MSGAVGLFADVIPQFAAMTGMPQAAERLGFDLAHPFAGDAHFPADFFERVGLPVQQAVS